MHPLEPHAHAPTAATLQPKQVTNALFLLRSLGALDTEERLTPLGRGFRVEMVLGNRGISRGIVRRHRVLHGTAERLSGVTRWSYRLARGDGFESPPRQEELVLGSWCFKLRHGPRSAAKLDLIYIDDMRPMSLSVRSVFL